MADELEVDLVALHGGIKATIAANFPDAAVDCYARPGEQIPLPGIFFELDSFDADDPHDIGTEQFACVLRFSAYVTTTYKSTGKLECRTMGLALAALIRGKKFGQPVGNAKVLGGYPDSFKADGKEYNVWRIEWEQSALVGEDVWKNVGEVPERLFVSYAPFIGPDHIERYKEVTELPQL